MEYNITIVKRLIKAYHKTEVKAMSRKNKGRKNNTLEKLVLATAILGLVKALIELINDLTG